MRNKMIAFLFPGQGAQFVGMGKELFNKFPEIVYKADEILNYSIKELCLKDEKNQLNQTEYTQVALYVVNCLYYLNEVQENKRKPDVIIGNSLGEYNALYAAGCISFEDGLRLVQERGRLMGQSKNGTMAAIIGLESEKIERILDYKKISGRVQISNYNTKMQNVIAGDQRTIDDILPFLLEKGAKKAVKLNVSGAFHSKYMEEAERKFEPYLRKVSFKAPSCVVFSNYTGDVYVKGDIFAPLLHQISNPVRLRKSILNAIKMGVTEYIELGPRRTMTKMFKEVENEYDMRKENSLGNSQFKNEYEVDYSYIVSGLRKGITSVEMIKKLRENNILGFIGIDGLKEDEIIEIIEEAKQKIPNKYIGVHITNDLYNVERTNKIIDYLIAQHISNVEISGFSKPNAALIKYRLKGISIGNDNTLTSINKILVHVNSVKNAEEFMVPIPTEILNELVLEGEISEKIASKIKNIPLCDDICIDNDKNGFEMLNYLKEENNSKNNDFLKKVRIGIGGRIGCPLAVAISFFSGADFILTTSINQCTIEARTSNYVKELLQNTTENDFSNAPIDELFEFGTRFSVLKKGSLYHIRALKLYEIYCQYSSFEEIPDEVKRTIFVKYFKTTYEEVFDMSTKELSDEEKQKIEEQPKEKMVLMFKKMLEKCYNDACIGNIENQANYLVLASSDMSDLNYFLKETEYAFWNKRSAVTIAKMLMDEGERMLQEKAEKIIKKGE